MDLNSFTAIGLLVASVIAIQNLIRYLRARDWNGVLGITLAVVGGVCAVALAAHSGVTDQLHLIQDGPPLGDLDFGSTLLLGISVGSVAPLVVDFRKALDKSDTAAKPALIPDSGSVSAGC